MHLKCKFNKRIIIKAIFERIEKIQSDYEERIWEGIKQRLI
mgnify:CR=1 FL=1